MGGGVYFCMTGRAGGGRGGRWVSATRPQSWISEFPHTWSSRGTRSRMFGRWSGPGGWWAAPSTPSHQVKGNGFSRLKDKRLSKWKNCLWIRKGHTLPVVRRRMHDVPFHSFQVQTCVSHPRVTLNHFTWAGELIWDCWALHYLAPHLPFKSHPHPPMFCFILSNLLLK